MNIRVVVVVLVLLLAALQYRLWWGPNGVVKVVRFQEHVEQMRTDNRELAASNETLKAEVRELKSGHDTIEALARSELGMIREGETFFFQPESR